MIKRITALALSVMMSLSVTGYAKTFSDVGEENKEVFDAVNTLSELEVISGMGDGSFKPSDKLTRAQFAKMAVCIMGKTKEAVATTDAFSDVKSNDWYSGYVNVVAKDGIITGYPDGSFGADDNVTYAQAITIVIRLLGYTAEDVGHKWPKGYIDKANVLSLTEGFTFNPDDVITRDKAALILYRALFTDMKNEEKTLVTRMGKNVYEDEIILATRNETASLLADEVKSASGTFKFDKNAVDMTAFVGCEGTLVVNNERKVIAFCENNNLSGEEYTVSAIYSESNTDDISVVTEGGETVFVPRKTRLYTQGELKSAGDIAEGVNAGSILTLYSENGSLKYAFLDEYKNRGPVTVYSAEGIERLFDIKDTQSVKVIRDGILKSMDDIEMYDVLYYSDRTNTIYAYCDRVSGMYEKAYPMKSNVSKITLSGKEYTLSSLSAVNKLNESEGAFEIGDRVTLLFGEDGDVVDAVDLTSADYSMYGVLVGSGTQLDDEGRTEIYVEILKTDGQTMKYEVDKNSYEKEMGNLCVVDFENSRTVLKFHNTGRSYGKVSREKKMIGETPVADNVTIFEYVSGGEDSARVTTVSMSDIDSLTLSKSDVRGCVYNQKGEIVILYLDDVTGNSRIYGIITEAPGKDDKGSLLNGVYKIMTKDTMYTYTGLHTSLGKGDCIEYRPDDKGSEMVELVNLASGSKISSLTDNKITMGGRVYTLSDTAVVFAGSKLSEMKTASWSDLETLSGRISLYGEKTTSSGGKVRIVIVYTN